jgi:hypothetical protein
MFCLIARIADVNFGIFFAGKDVSLSDAMVV